VEALHIESRRGGSLPSPESFMSFYLDPPD
jgi:hypothetical protein